MESKCLYAFGKKCSGKIIFYKKVDGQLFGDKIILWKR